MTQRTPLRLHKSRVRERPVGDSTVTHHARDELYIRANSVEASTHGA